MTSVPNGKNVVRGLAISGGGSKGAEGHGIACALQASGRTYDAYAGTSVGAAIASVAALGMVSSKEVIDLFQGRGVEGLWAIDPFAKGFVKKTLNWLKAWRKSGHAIGDFSGLRSVIAHTYAKAWSNRVENAPCFVSCVSETGKLHNIRIDEASLEGAVRAIYASCSPPIISAGEYASQHADASAYEELMFDGGIVEHIPILPLIRHGCDEIDVILHGYKVELQPINTVADAAAMTLSILLSEVSNSDMEIARLSAMISKETSKRVALNVYEATFPIKNSFVFNPEEMAAAWESGYNSIATKSKPVTRIINPL